MTIVPVSSRWPMVSSAAANSRRSNPSANHRGRPRAEDPGGTLLIRVLEALRSIEMRIPRSVGSAARRVFLPLPRAPVAARVRRIPRSSGRQRDSTCHRRRRRWSPLALPVIHSRFAHPPLLPRRPIVPPRRGRREHPRRDPRASRQSTRMVFLYRTFARDRRGIDRGLMARTRDNRLAENSGTGRRDPWDAGTSAAGSTVIYCGLCGALNPASSYYCAACGTTLVDAFHATEGLRVFERPDPAARLIEILPSGSELDLVADPAASADWLRIACPMGDSGMCRRRKPRPRPPGPTASLRFRPLTSIPTRAAA